jgi:hypothetical protein
MIENNYKKCIANYTMPILIPLLIGAYFMAIPYYAKGYELFPGVTVSLNLS